MVSVSGDVPHGALFSFSGREKLSARGNLRARKFIFARRKLTLRGPRPAGQAAHAASRAVAAAPSLLIFYLSAHANESQSPPRRYYRCHSRAQINLCALFSSILSLWSCRGWVWESGALLAAVFHQNRHAR
jgi:hypothetical protein